MPSVVLASASPRRRDLLHYICQDFTQHAADIDESPLHEESATDLVQRLAKHKAMRVLEKLPDSIVLGADTLIECDTKILGKPSDYQDYLSMMRMLSGNTHLVHTAVACLYSSRVLCELVSTVVEFAKISDKDALQYWQSAEPIDKAGGYAIQGLGGQFVKRLNGSYSAVVGLPLHETKQMLETIR